MEEQKTLSSVRCAIRLYDKKGYYYNNLGNAYFIYKKYAKAIKTLEKAVQIETIYPSKGKLALNMRDVNYLTFKCFFNLPTINYEKCSTLIQGLIKEEPNNIEYLDYFANLQERKNRKEEAIATYKAIMKLDPQNENAKNSLSRLEG